MSKEIKCQPLAEKKGSGKKSNGLGAPPVTLASSFDAYERMLGSVVEFAGFGKLFKVLPSSSLLTDPYKFLYASLFRFYSGNVCVVLAVIGIYRAYRSRNRVCCQCCQAYF